MKSDHHQKLVDLSKLKHNDDNFLSILNIWPETAFLGVYPIDKSLLQNLSKKLLNPKKMNFYLQG